MAKLIPLTVIAAAALAACSTPPPQAGGPAEPKIVTNVQPYNAGSGVVQAVFPAPAFAVPAAAGAGSASASAGKSSAPAGSSPASQPLQRLEIKMDNGSIQYVDTPAREITKGMRVTLTEDRLIRKM
jgi:hypothetical protein